MGIKIIGLFDYTSMSLELDDIDRNQGFMSVADNTGALESISFGEES